MPESRVLMLSWEYPPIVEGGLGRHVRKVAEGLAVEGVRVHVLTRGTGYPPPVRGRLTADEDLGDVVVHRVAQPRRPGELDRFLPWVEQMNLDLREAGEELVGRIRPDLIHGHDWLVAGAGLRVADHFDLPYVTTIHATEWGRHQGWVDAAPQAHVHGVETWMARRSDRVIVCSEHMRSEVADAFGLAGDAVSVIPNGIESRDLDALEDLDAVRAVYAGSKETLVLLAGRLVYEKGFHVALDALSAVVERFDRTRFVIAGSGPEQAALRAQVERLGLGTRGRFLGWVGEDVLHSLYRVADLTVVPSLYEPFGLVALEAMASGCPCVVADVGGLREVVPPHVGLRFRAGDPAALTRMIEIVLSDPALRDGLVRQASEHVRRFDWADVARRTAAVYAALAGRRTPAAVPG